MRKEPAVNRYVEAGLLADARDGRTVVVIQPRRRDAHSTFMALAQEARDSASAVLRANGRERIDFPSGGRVQFHTPGPGMRGVSADVVFIEGWNELSEAQRSEIAPVVCARGGEVIRA